MFIFPADAMTTADVSSFLLNCLAADPDLAGYCGFYP